VRDGNHQVSVARQLGAATIQAHVTELPTSIPLHPGMSEEELDSAEAYAAFSDATELSLTRPLHQPILLSEPTRYVDLLGHINLHQAVMSQREGREVSLREAAADWYDNVYRPAVTLIRKYRIMELLPRRGDTERTEGDVYLWMIDHLREAIENLGDAGGRTTITPLTYLARQAEGAASAWALRFASAARSRSARSANQPVMLTEVA
jgi:hypothetical protein